MIFETTYVYGNKTFKYYILFTPGGLIIGFIFGIITALITKATSEIRVLGNHFLISKFVKGNSENSSFKILFFCYTIIDI